MDIRSSELDQVRRERDARDQDQLHERAGEHRGEASVRTSRPCAWASAPIRASATASSIRAPATAAPASRRTFARWRVRRGRPDYQARILEVRRGRQRQPEVAAVRQDRQALRRQARGQDVRALGSRVQAQHRRHARGALARDHGTALEGGRHESVPTIRSAMNEARHDLRRAARPHVGEVRLRSARRRRCARDRDRVAGVPQPGFRPHQGDAVLAGGVRRPQPVQPPS